MAIIDVPAGASFRGIDWTLDQPAQVNRSDWTKRRQVVTQPGPSLWSASGEFVAKRLVATLLAVRAFLVDLEGQRNSFRLVAVEAPQARIDLTPVVDGGGQSGRALNVRGGIAGETLLRGHLFTVDDELKMLMAPVTFGSDGKATFAFKPSLRGTPADGDGVEVRKPWAFVSLTDSAVGWKVDAGQLYQAKAISVEEAI